MLLDDEQLALPVIYCTWPLTPQHEPVSCFYGGDFVFGVFSCSSNTTLATNSLFWVKHGQLRRGAPNLQPPRWATTAEISAQTSNWATTTPVGLDLRLAAGRHVVAIHKMNC